MIRYVTVGLSVVAGAALFEAALIPGILIGGAAVLAPSYLPGLGRRLQQLFESAPDDPTEDAGPVQPDIAAQLPARRAFGIKRAVAKTITFRIIVTTLDFTSNYVVLGELATAAGLSTFALVSGPLFYFVHEAAWNYLGPAGDTVDVALPASGRSDAPAPSADNRGFTISRALAKTITFRTVATAVDFTATYVVVGEAATAALLSAFGFVVGPFVYLGHEKAWDYYAPTQESTVEPPAPVKLLPAPA